MINMKMRTLNIGMQLLTISSPMYTLMTYVCGWREPDREGGCTYARVYFSTVIFSSELEWGRDLGLQASALVEDCQQERERDLAY